jgi:hypothetical protein
MHVLLLLLLLLLLPLLLQADVLNRGMSGWNTRWAARALPTTLQQLVPAVDRDESARRAASRSRCGWKLKVSPVLFHVLSREQQKLVLTGLTTLY